MLIAKSLYFSPSCFKATLFLCSLCKPWVCSEKMLTNIYRMEHLTYLVISWLFLENKFSLVSIYINTNLIFCSYSVKVIHILLLYTSLPPTLQIFTSNYLAKLFATVHALRYINPCGHRSLTTSTNCLKF